MAGLAIRVDTTIVGFVVLRRRRALGAWAPSDAAGLTAMRIDVAHQGAGLGRRALDAIARWIPGQWPECTAIALQVDVGNVAGQRAYERGGFVPSGEPTDGRIGPVLTMVRRLALAPS